MSRAIPPGRLLAAAIVLVATQGRAADGPATLNPLNAATLGDLTAFRARPLFAPSRRAPATSIVEADAAAPTGPTVSPAPDLRLVGIIAGVDKAVAILRRPGEGEAISVKVGDLIDAWRVQTISPSQVVLRDGDREQGYRLFVGGAAPPAAPSP